MLPLLPPPPSLQHFASMVVGLARLSLYTSPAPPRAVVRTWLERLYLHTHHRLLAFKPSELAAIMWACGLMAHHKVLPANCSLTGCLATN